MWISTIPIYLEVAPVSDSIPNASWFVKADDPQALTRILGLSEFRVTGVEYDDRLDRVIVFCQHVWDVAQCPDCQQLSTHVHQYHRRVVHDLAWVGHACYLEFRRGVSVASTAGGPLQKTWRRSARMVAVRGATSSSCSSNVVTQRSRQ